MIVWIAVTVLGGAGAVGRLVLDAAVSERAGDAFPWGTLAVNLSGAFALGVLAGADVAGDALLLAGTALLGDVLYVDAQVPPPRRGRRAGANVAQPRAAAVHGARGRCAGTGG